MERTVSLRLVVLSVVAAFVAGACWMGPGARPLDATPVAGGGSQATREKENEKDPPSAAGTRPSQAGESGADEPGESDPDRERALARLRADERALVSLFERVSPSVVYISNIGLQRRRRDFFTLDIQKVPQGTGTGFIWDDAGHVVTNYHVIRSADEVTVTMIDQTTWPARLVGVAADKDLAVLRIDASPEQLKPVEKGRSDSLFVGQTALAIGNPFGLDNTLTQGIVSALGREITAVTGRTITDVIQTDAAINPGNSGGPLLDSRGELIGVNTAIVSQSGSSAGIGFAVPVDTVRRVVGQILKYGRVIQPGIGIVYLRDEYARRIGLKRGVLVQRVLEGSTASRAGLRGIRYFRDGRIALGDIIVQIDDHEIRDSDDLFKTLDRYRVGDRVEVQYLRDRELRSVTIELQAIGES